MAAPEGALDGALDDCFEFCFDFWLRLGGIVNRRGVGWKGRRSKLGKDEVHSTVSRTALLVHLDLSEDTRVLVDSSCALEPSSFSLTEVIADCWLLRGPLFGSLSHCHQPALP